MRTPNEECTYCGGGERVFGVTRQAVFVDEWYSEDTSWSVVRPGVPTCRICAWNVRGVQRRLWLRWALATADKNPYAIGIHRRAVQVFWDLDAVESSGTGQGRRAVACLGRHTAAWRSGSAARSAAQSGAELSSVCDLSDVEAMTRRCARALFRWEFGEPLPMDATIQSAQLSRERPGDVLRAIEAQGLRHRALPPAICYWFARTDDSDSGSLWYVAIWERIVLFARTSPRRHR